MVRWLVGMMAGLLLTVHGQAAELGGIRGSVFDKEFSVPLGKVQVTVVEATRVTQTSEDGFFTIEGVVPGKYTVLFGKDGFLRQAAEVTVPVGGFADVRIELAGEVTEMEEFVVRGLDLAGGTELGLLEIRQETSGLQDAISADLIRKAGASTAAAALKMVVGTSVQEGKYVVIRGLADRYTSTTLNDMRIPTADAEKRAVQLDQFPSAQIESLTVYKTFTPDLQGEATGGAVNIKTKSIPDAPFLAVSGAVEYNTQSTGNGKFLSYKGGGVDAFAMDDGRRDLPFAARQSVVPDYQRASVNPGIGASRLPNAQLLDQLTRSFQPTMGTSTKEVGPNYNWSVAAGDKWQLGEAKFGALGAFSYRQKYQFDDAGVYQKLTLTAPDATPTIVNSYHDTRGVDEVQWSASLGLGYQPQEDHQIGLAFVYNQTATDTARFLEDSVTNPDSFLQSQSLRYNERTLASVQLHGRHEFDQIGGVKLNWTGAYNLASQNEPDQRFFNTIYEPASGLNGYSSPGGEGLNGNLRIWRTIEETSKQGKMDLEIPFQQWTGTKGLIKLGPSIDMAERQFRSDSFTYVSGYPRPGTMNPGDWDNLDYVSGYGGPGLWTDVFLNPNRIGLATNGARAVNQLIWFIQPSFADINYEAEQLIAAGFGMVELPLTPWFKVIGGARAELTDMQINITEVSRPSGTVQVIRRDEFGNYYFQDVAPSEAGSQIKQWDILPSLGAVWEVVPKLFLRGSWSQTIARPTFREMAPVRTYEFLGGDQFVGNPNLQISHIDNYDLRVEWFRRPGDVLAGSVFYKQIEKPIEQIYFAAVGDNRFSQRVNYPAGKVFGVELECRQRLDVLAPWLGDFTVGANGSYIMSEVTLPADEQQDWTAFGEPRTKRRMLGQPDFLLNLNCVYDNARSGTSVGLFYNWTGEVLASGGTPGNPDQFELPTDSLDFSVEQKLGKHWRVMFRAKNLTDPLIQRVYRLETQHQDVTLSHYRRGMDFSLGVSCAW